jgi:hypothetical protein
VLLLPPDRAPSLIRDGCNEVHPYHNKPTIPLKQNTMASPQVGVASGLIAAGTNQITALDLSGYTGFNQLSTVASGTGVQLPPAVPGFNLILSNNGANACLVYPLLGGIINSLAVNVGYSLGPGAVVEFMCKDGLNWYSVSSGSSSGSGIGGFNSGGTALVAATTLTTSQSGQVLGLNGAGSAVFTVTLPTASAGLQYEFVVQTAAVAHSITITSTTALMYGDTLTADAVISSSPLSATLTTNYIFVASAAIVGDRLLVRCLDGTHWICNGLSNVHTGSTVS